jgi:trigger factor
MRGAPVVFDVTLRRIQERILPDWEEMPTLENFEGSLADFKIKTSDELAKNANTNSENRLINAFVDGLVAGAIYDYSDVAVEQEADRVLTTQEAEYTRYGTTAEAVYKQMGQDRKELVKRLLPEGEERLKRNLAMREFVLAEGLTVSDEEIDAEIGAMLGDYSGDQRDAMLGLLRGQMVTSIANSVLDKKMRARIVEIATQGAGAVAATEAPASPKKRTTKKAADVADVDAEATPAPKKKSTKKSE